MRLLREFIQPNEVDNILLESTNGEKDILIRGVFAQADVVNSNKRCYPLSIMEREAYKIQQKIATTGLTGELDHPEKPEYNLSNAAIKINKYIQDSKNFVGEARILKDTAKGRTAWGLAKEGIKFGMSTRALGSLDEKDGVFYVKEDLNMITIDLVGDPSAPNAWAESIMEQMEYLVSDGYIKEDKANWYIQKLKNLKKDELKEGIIKIYNDFIKEI